MSVKTITSFAQLSATFSHELVCHAQADKLLSPEFQPIIEQLISFAPPDRQICLYSATFPVTVKQFKEKFLKKPYIINLMEELTLKGITQVHSQPEMPACMLFLVPKTQRLTWGLYMCSTTLLLRRGRKSTA